MISNALDFYKNQSPTFANLFLQLMERDTLVPKENDNTASPIRNLASPSLSFIVFTYRFVFLQTSPCPSLKAGFMQTLTDCTNVLTTDTDRWTYKPLVAVKANAELYICSKQIRNLQTECGRRDSCLIICRGCFILIDPFIILLSVYSNIASFTVTITIFD